MDSSSSEALEISEPHPALQQPSVAGRTGGGHHLVGAARHLFFQFFGSLDSGSPVIGTSQCGEQAPQASMIHVVR
ncbi:MAG: hypothetical protein R2710_22970 [Acidimicrobiales bacterium]